MSGWKKPSDNKIIGKSYPRLDAPIKATGKAKYSYDINLPGLLFGRIFRSEVPNAIVKSIDVTAAQKIPGVIAINVTAVAGSKVRYQGQELGALCATSSDIAEDAIRAIKVVYTPIPHVVSEARAILANAPSAMEKGSNIVPMSKTSNGDVDAAFKVVAFTASGKYSCPVRAHLSLETHGVTCKWDSDTHLTCWASTQGVFSVQGELARHFSIPATDVEVITEVMGGGFGSKFGAGYEGIQCAELAKKTGKPVKLLLTRQAFSPDLGKPAGKYGDHLDAGTGALFHRVDHPFGRADNIRMVGHLGQRCDRWPCPFAQHGLAARIDRVHGALETGAAQKQHGPAGCLARVIGGAYDGNAAGGEKRFCQAGA